jgi:hypothetical protein
LEKCHGVERIGCIAQQLGPCEAVDPNSISAAEFTACREAILEATCTDQFPPQCVGIGRKSESAVPSDRPQPRSPQPDQKDI